MKIKTTTKCFLTFAFVAFILLIIGIVRAAIEESDSTKSVLTVAFIAIVFFIPLVTLAIETGCGKGTTSIHATRKINAMIILPDQQKDTHQRVSVTNAVQPINLPSSVVKSEVALLEITNKDKLQPVKDIHEALFAFHDNTAMSKFDSGTTCMIETKTSNSEQVVMLGYINRSGPARSIISTEKLTSFGNVDSLMDSQDIEAQDEFRGAFVYEIKAVRYYQPSHCEQKANGRTGEIRFSANHGSLIGAKDMQRIFNSCPGKVDLIFDPQCNMQGWYPWLDENGKKLPPMFRSNGVGYMKLGGEMSENGRHFLSADGGKTFMDEDEEEWC